MRKYILKLLFAVTALTFIFTGCGINTIEEEENQVKKNTVVKQAMTLREFEEMLRSLPLAVTETEYIAPEETGEAVYPAEIRATIKNNTDSDIKNATVAFVGWDETGFPVKIKGKMDYSGGEYVKKAHFSSVNMVSGGIFGENEGVLLSEDCELSMLKAIALSFETFDGDKWENPYFNQFCGFFEGKPYIEDSDVEIELMDSSFTPAEETFSDNNKEEITEEELIEALDKQPLYVSGTEYVIQDEVKKALYPDILKVSLKSNTETDIESAVVAFVAWDENNLPVKITGTTDLEGGDFIKEVAFTEDIIKGGTKRDWNGVSLTEKNKIATFKAIVASYKAVNGETWKNPLYEDFCRIYKEKKLIITEEVEE